MDSDILIQTALHRNQIKRPLLEKISTSRDVDSLHITTVLQTLSRLIRAQDVAFSHQYKLALSYLLLNRFDIFPPGSLSKAEQEGLFQRQSSIKAAQHVQDGGGDSASIRSGYTSASAARDDDDEDDDDDDEYTPIVPQKMDLLLSQISLLDPELIQTYNVPKVLPKKSFPTGIPIELEETVPPCDKIAAKKLNNILLTPTSPQTSESFTTITNEQLSKQFSFNQLTPLSPLQYHHQNTHIVSQYNTIFPQLQHSHRIYLCSEPLSLQDCHDTLLACFAPVLLLLALHNIISLALEDPDEHGDLFFMHPKHPKTSNRGPNYILFQSKTHLRIFLQQYFCNNIEFIPLTIRHFQPAFFSSQLPPSLYTPYSAHPLEPKFQPKELEKYKDTKVIEAVRNMYPTAHQPNVEQFPSILTQLTAKPTDTAFVRSRLQTAYTAAKRNPQSTPTDKDSYVYPRQSAPLDSADTSFDYYLSEYTEIPPLPEDMNEWEDILIKFYDEYTFHPATPSNPSHITSTAYSQLSDAVRKADEIEDIVPKTQLTSAIPHTNDYSRPLLKNGQYGQTLVDIENMTSSEFIRMYITIARQNNYRVLSAQSTNSKIITKAAPIMLSEYVGWQYHQMQDQYVLYTYLRCYLKFINYTFFQRILNDSPANRAKYLICVTNIPYSSSQQSSSVLFLNNKTYNDIISTPVMGVSSLFDIAYTSRPLHKFLVNDVYAHVDITPFFANRTIYPTNLSLLSYSLFSTSFIQPRLATHCFTTYYTRVPAKSLKDMASGAQQTSISGCALNGVLHDLLSLLQPTPFPGVNTPIQYSLFELVLYAQSTITSGLLPYLTAKWSQSDSQFLTDGQDQKTLHSLFYSLLSKESSTSFESSVRSPTKKPLQNQQNSTIIGGISSPIDSDHQINNLTNLGKQRYDTLNENQVLEYISKIAPNLRSIYAATVEYMISFGLSNIFTKFSTHRLSKIQYSLFAAIPSSKFAAIYNSYSFTIDNSDMTDSIGNYNQMLNVSWKPIESTEQLITTSFLSRLTGFLTPPSYQIHQATPYLLIDIYEHSRAVTNRIQFTSLNTIVAQHPSQVLPNMYKITKLYDIIEWHWEKRFIEWCEGNQSNFKELKALRKDWEDQLFIKHVLEIVDYEKSPQELIMKLKQHPELIGTNAIPLNQLSFKDYKKILAVHPETLKQIESLRGPLRQKSVFFSRDYQAHVSTIYQGLTQEMSASTFSDIFSTEAMSPNLDNTASLQGSDPDLTNENYSELKRFHLFDIMKRMGVYLSLSNIYKNDQSFSHVLSLKLPNDRNILATHGAITLAAKHEGQFGALLERQQTLDRIASTNAVKKSISPKQQTKDLLSNEKNGVQYHGVSSWNEGENIDVTDFDDEIDSELGVEDLFSIGSSQNIGEESNSIPVNNNLSNPKVPMSPFVRGDSDTTIDPMSPMSPLKNHSSHLEPSFMTPKRPGNTVDMTSLFNTPGGNPTHNATNQNKLLQSCDDTGSPYSAVRKMPSTSPRIPHSKLHSAIHSDGEANDSENEFTTTDKLNQSMNDFGPEIPSPRNNNLNKQLSRSPPPQLSVELLKQTPAPTPIAPKSTREDLSPLIIQHLSYSPGQFVPKPILDENNQHPSTSTLLSQRKKSQIQSTLLFDNALIIYTEEQLKKFTPIQLSRYRVRRRLFDSIYSTHFGHDKVDYSDSSSSESDSDNNIDDTGTNTNDESNGTKKISKKNPIFSKKFITNTLDRISKWKKHKSFNFSLLMQQNTIATIKLEEILVLTPTHQTQLEEWKSSQNNIDVVESNAAAESSSIGSQCKCINTDEKLLLLKQYISFDTRFISVSPQLYPSDQC